MIVIEMVKEHIKHAGRDGLFSSDNGCACLVDDLAPACEDFSIADCEDGYKVKCTSKCAHEAPDCDWHIQSEKPQETREARGEPCVFPRVPDPDP